MSLAILESTADRAQVATQHPMAAPPAMWVISGRAGAFLRHLGPLHCTRQWADFDFAQLSLPLREITTLNTPPSHPSAPRAVPYIPHTTQNRLKVVVNPRGVGVRQTEPGARLPSPADGVGPQTPSPGKG